MERLSTKLKKKIEKFSKNYFRYFIPSEFNIKKNIQILIYQRTWKKKRRDFNLKIILCDESTDHRARSVSHGIHDMEEQNKKEAMKRSEVMRGWVKWIAVAHIWNRKGMKRTAEAELPLGMTGSPLRDSSGVRPFEWRPPAIRKINLVSFPVHDSGSPPIPLLYTSLHPCSRCSPRMSRLWIPTGRLYRYLHYYLRLCVLYPLCVSLRINLYFCTSCLHFQWNPPPGHREEKLVKQWRNSYFIL